MLNSSYLRRLFKEDAQKSELICEVNPMYLLQMIWNK